MWPCRVLPIIVFLFHFCTCSSLRSELNPIAKAVAAYIDPFIARRFRDDVVKRPTPPNGNAHFWEIDVLRKSKDLKALERACDSLQRNLWLKATLQEPIFIQGGHKFAMKAMNDFPKAGGLQIKCGNLFAGMANWNWVLARALADAGALHAMVAALKNNPDDDQVQSMMPSDIGAFCDFDEQNKKIVVEQGIVEHVYKMNDEKPSGPSAAYMYNLWSTLCRVPEVAEQMVEKNGQLERGVRHMKTYNRTTLRGEVLEVHRDCFMQTEAMRKRSFEAGMIPEVVRALRDELSGEFGELDLIGRDRMLSNALFFIQAFGSMGQQYIDAIREAGGVDQVVAVLKLWRTTPHEKHEFSELQHDLEKEACGALAALSMTSSDYGCPAYDALNK